MSTERFSKEFSDFVRDNIISVEQIHVLLLLHEHPESSFSASDLSAALSSTPRSVLHRLNVLLNRRLVERVDGSRFRYASESERDRLVGELRREYSARPVSVIGLIFSERSGALESFSDAFLLGGDDNDR